MDGYQFIIESPQEAGNHKKRPRLVTSCDNCRNKKIKCIRNNSDSECEACKLSQFECIFGDRQRYLAERGRIFGEPIVTHPAARPGHTEDTSSGAGSVPDFSDPGPQSDQPATDPSPEFSYCIRGESLVQCRSPLLFEPGHPSFPQRAWMQQFIQLFITDVSAQCPLFTYEDLYDEFRRQTLPPLLANCIAALGARSSDIPDVVSRGPQAVAETYSDMAKEQLSTSLQRPSIETLQATILLAWVEYENGRAHVFCQYSDLATQIAMAIGLSEESSLQLSLYDPYRNRLQATWSSLTQLRLYASPMAVQKLG